MPLPIPITRTPADAAYIVRKPITIDGIHYKDGDVLPADSSLRAFPQYIKTLVAHRSLELQAPPIKASAKPKEEPVKVPTKEEATATKSVPGKTNAVRDRRTSKVG